ncbi:hypothetical protein LSAT2_029794 [Lamellibrachia satsuma]|nr:hypothetical protein LSAT2_029794 [Lamellibrachia satsuma]
MTLSPFRLGVNIAIRFTSKNYTKDLEDKTSDAYNSLKKEVVKTLKDVLTKELEAGTFDIVDVTFSDGSIVVNYELAVKKAAATETLNTIVDTVKKATEDGSFGNFTIDPTSIQATKSDLFSFYGKFTITNREYNDQLTEPSSTTYKNMFDEVKQTVRKVFVDSDIGNDVVAVTEITFSKGSIIVSYQLVLKEKFTLVHLTAIMKKYLQEHGGKLGSFEVKADSIDFRVS